MNDDELDTAARHYYSHVSEAADYLTARGITGAIAQQALLGYVKDPLPGHDLYAGRIVLPYLTPAGIVDLRFRAVGDGVKPKYLSLPGAHPRLYNTTTIAADPPVIGVCEGEFDALILTHHVGLPTVALPGAQTWHKRRHPRIFRGFDRVLVFPDGDEPGRGLAKEIAGAVRAAVVIDLGDGMDVTDAYLAYGSEWIRERAGLAA